MTMELSVYDISSDNSAYNIHFHRSHHSKVRYLFQYQCSGQPKVTIIHKTHFPLWHGSSLQCLAQAGYYSNWISFQLPISAWNICVYSVAIWMKQCNLINPIHVPRKTGTKSPDKRRKNESGRLCSASGAMLADTHWSVPARTTTVYDRYGIWERQSEIAHLTRLRFLNVNFKRMITLLLTKCFVVHQKMSQPSQLNITPPSSSSGLALLAIQM